MKPYVLSPERLTLRFELLAMGALAVAMIEGMLLRVQLVNVPLLATDHWYAILTAHPLVGIYGWAYLSVMGAFLYLVPKLLGKPLYSLRLASVSLWFLVVGLALAWSSGFCLHFASLYTVYWPLPVVRFPPVSVIRVPPSMGPDGGLICWTQGASQKTQVPTTSSPALSSKARTMTSG